MACAARTRIAELCRKRRHRAEPVLRLGRRSSWRLASAAWPGDTARAATTDEVKDLRREASALKEVRRRPDA